MRQGNDCNVIQTVEGQVIPQGSVSLDYADNKYLIEIAQRDGGESEAAMNAMEALIEANRGLVKKIALRFKDRGVELEDLLQIGTIGMIKAVRSFDLSRGTCFSTYAVPLIFGEMRRYIRDEGPVKVGRYYKKLGACLARHKSDIFAREGREPKISELASLCGVSVEEAAIAIDAMSPIASLSDSAYGDEDGVAIEDTLADEDSVCEARRIIDKIALAQAISDMNGEWQKIVTLRYYRNMTQQQVATLLGITQVKVSREEKKILAYLKMRMADV